MNDKDRELVEQVLNAAGTAGQQGFHYMVHYQLVDGASSILVSLWALIVIRYLLRRAFAWPALEEAMIAKGMAILMLSIGALVFLFALQSGLSQCFAPEGAAIHAVIHH